MGEVDFTGQESETHAQGEPDECSEESIVITEEAPQPISPKASESPRLTSVQSQKMAILLRLCVCKGQMFRMHCQQPTVSQVGRSLTYPNHQFPRVNSLEEKKRGDLRVRVSSPRPCPSETSWAFWRERGNAQGALLLTSTKRQVGPPHVRELCHTPPLLWS